MDAPATASTLPRTERLAVIAILGVSAVLRIAACLRALPDSDEPQHLHVSWGWSRGLVQHRDFFDNHAPLFHILTGPLVKLLGETPQTLLWARVALVPVTALLLWGVWRIGRALFGVRTAAWAVAGW